MILHTIDLMYVYKVIKIRLNVFRTDEVFDNTYKKFVKK